MGQKKDEGNKEKEMVVKDWNETVVEDHCVIHGTGTSLGEGEEWWMDQHQVSINRGESYDINCSSMSQYQSIGLKRQI
jgi:hypothetical protein